MALGRSEDCHSPDVPPATPSNRDRRPGTTCDARFVDTLATSLSDRFRGFYQTTRVGRGRSGSCQDGEPDFVVIHPDPGLLILEVEAGGIERAGLRASGSREPVGTNSTESKIRWRGRHAVVMHCSGSSETAIAGGRRINVIRCKSSECRRASGLRGLG